MKSKFLLLLFVVLLSVNVSAMQTYRIARLRPGDVYRVEPMNMAISRYYFSVDKFLPRVNVTVKREFPANVPSQLNDTYQYFSINFDGLINHNVKDAEIEVKVNDNWLRIKQYDGDLIAIRVYDNGWEILPTTKAGLIDGERYFRAKTSKLGYFAITANTIIEKEEPEIVEEEFIPELAQPSPPAFTRRQVMLTMAGLIAFGLIIAIIFFSIKETRHPYPELINYVKDSIDKGAELKEIKKILIKAGWPRKEVNHELRRYEKHEPVQHPVNKHD